MTIFDLEQLYQSSFLKVSFFLDYFPKSMQSNITKEIQRRFEWLLSKAFRETMSAGFGSKGSKCTTF
jgi:hypothetical protein